MAVNRPDVWFGLALNADPNDPYVSPVWTDFTSSLRKVSGLERGRNFELDQPMASEPSLRIRDVSELLNPANLSSPHVNLIQPYREACLLAQWPSTPLGAAVNLHNTGNWRGNKEDVHDGDFESFADNTVPSWITAVGGMTPAVNTGVAFNGNKKLFYSNVASTAVQGVTWPEACIPGRQYTCSVYVNQASASTQRISVADQVLGADPFNTTNATGLGTDRLGHPWTIQAGAAADMATANLLATIALTGAGAEKIATIDAGSTDHTATVKIQAPDPATVGASGVEQGLVVRLTDASNYYVVKALWRAGGDLGLSTTKRVAGVGSVVVAEVATGWTYRAGDWFILEVATTTVGTNALINSTVWPETKPRPAPQNAGVDASLLTGNRVGMRALTNSAIGFPYTVRFAGFNVVGYVHGSTTAATGAYTRVSVTWTATAPTHTVQFATTGTALAGIVRVDAIQHEQAAAASAYNTGGPSIYPVMRNLVEQWPRTWESAGFEGFVDAPCVDGLAALNAIDLETEYVQAVLNSGVDLFYRLGDGTQAVQFADTSGNGGPVLVPIVGKGGPGNGLNPGTQIDIPGDPGATGLNIVRNTGLDGTVIGSTTPVAVPAYASVPWAATFAAWVQLSTPGTATQMVLRVTGRQLLLTLGALITGEGCLLAAPTLGGSTIASAASILDGKVHHLAATITMDATNTTLTAYVDGVAGTPVTVGTAATFGGIPSLVMDTVQIGGMALGYPSGSFGASMNGTAADVGIWQRALSASEINALWLAGGDGFSNERTGARIGRHLTSGGYLGPTRITSAPTQTHLQAATWTGTKDLLTDSLESTGAELGTFWVAPDGATVFEGRQDRWLRLTPSFVLGENTAGGEIPYLMDGARFVPDPLYTYANVRIGRLGGITAVGGTTGDVAIAARRYFPRSVEGSFDFYTDDLAQSIANFIFNTHDAPMTRVDAITVDPSSNPALWPFALGLEIGQRGTVKRRAKAANSGAGITMSADYFVEKITTDEIDFDTWEWTFRVQLSPINAAPPPGQPTMQPWILGDATYGVLNSTTVLGW